MIYKKETMPWSYSAAATSFYNYLSQYDNRFTLDSGNNTIDFDNKFKVKFTTGNYGRPALTIICSDTSQTQHGTYSTGASWNNTSSVSCFLMIDTNFLYFKVIRDASNYVGFVWIKDKDNNNYAAGMAAGNQAIDVLSFYNVVTNSNTDFKLSPFFNFEIPVGQVYYTDKCILLASTAGEAHEVNGWSSCSTVSLFDNYITIEGKNYYVIGNNTLIPVED